MKRELDGSDAAKSVRTGAPGISSPNGWLIGIGVVYRYLIFVLAPKRARVTELLLIAVLLAPRSRYGYHRVVVREVLGAIACTFGGR